MKSVNNDSYRRMRDLCFQVAHTERAYMPVALKVTFTDEQTGSNPFHAWQEDMTYGPEEMFETECYVLAGRDFADDHVLFILGPEDEVAYGYDARMGRIELTFEAEAFAYIMENASRANKLTFFRSAKIRSIVEANKFLAVIDNSLTISEKDRNRAWTWVQQLVKGRSI